MIALDELIQGLNFMLSEAKIKLQLDSFEYLQANETDGGWTIRVLKPVQPERKLLNGCIEIKMQNYQDKSKQIK